jgi:hypothetical protein
MANPNQSGGGSRGDSNRGSQGNIDRDNLSRTEKQKRELENEEDIRDVSNETRKSPEEKRDMGKGKVSGESRERGGNLGNKDNR